MVALIFAVVATVAATDHFKNLLGKGTYSEVVRSQLGNADVVVKKMQGGDANGISQTALREVCTPALQPP